MQTEPSKKINICTPSHPYTKGDPGRWEHPSAEVIEEDYSIKGGVADGDFILYKCPFCQHTWWEELPN